VSRVSMKQLQREAKESCEWRGHSMIPWQYHSFWKNITYSSCSKCSGFVQCDTAPPPNGIDIGGSAVAENCPIKEGE